MTYSAGDYLAILPLNPQENIQRAMRHFGLSWDSMLTLSSAGPTTLPVDQPISALDVFGAYVELAQPASKRNVHALADATRDEATQKELTRLAEDAFGEEITAKRVSVLDLLERFPSVQLPLGVFLKMQPPMRVRQYSISSSPLWNPNNVTLTYAVVDQPALSGQGRFVGVATNYLSNLAAGDKLHVSVRSSHQAFHLPKDSKNVPVIMIAAGTGKISVILFTMTSAHQEQVLHPSVVSSKSALLSLLPAVNLLPRFSSMDATVPIATFCTLIC
jgi:cytochrome P450/NADPH-cytochrome P450 reductase